MAGTRKLIADWDEEPLVLRSNETADKIRTTINVKRLKLQKVSIVYSYVLYQIYILEAYMLYE